MMRGPDLIGLVEDYLDENDGTTPLPDAVRDAIRARLPVVQQRPPWRPIRRMPEMNATRKFALGAVAVTVIALGSLQLIGTANVGEPRPAPLTSPPPTATGSLTSESTPAPAPSCDSDVSGPDEVSTGRLDPGTYTCYGVGGGMSNATFTVPAGWEWHGSFLSKGGLDSPEEARISFFHGDIQVYPDPCRWSEPTPDARTGPAVTHLMNALAAQPMRNATTPVDRPADLGGLGADMPNRWDGMAIELAVPEDISFADCDGGQFRSWGPEHNVRFHQAPGQQDLVWAVDLSGNGVMYGDDRLVIDASWLPDTPTDVILEIDAILKSIGAGHWG